MKLAVEYNHKPLCCYFFYLPPESIVIIVFRESQVSRSLQVVFTWAFMRSSRSFLWVSFRLVFEITSTRIKITCGASRVLYFRYSVEHLDIWIPTYLPTYLWVCPALWRPAADWTGTRVHLFPHGPRSVSCLRSIDLACYHVLPAQEYCPLDRINAFYSNKTKSHACFKKFRFISEFFFISPIQWIVYYK